MCLDPLLASINEHEKKVSHVVKATVESSLGQLGTVGAMAIEDFVDRLKSFVGNVVNVEKVSSSSTVGGTGIVQTPVVVPPTGSVTVCECGTDASSAMPSAFGDARSILTSGVPATTAAKPGKNLIRSHDGF